MKFLSQKVAMAEGTPDSQVYQNRLNFGGGSSDSSATESWTPEQIEELRKLTGAAMDWFGGGGLSGTGNEYLGKMEDVLGSAGEHYMNILTGESDTAGLQNVLNMQSSQAQDNLNTQLAGLSESANMAGGAGGSRSGIAQGMATSQANQTLADQQTKTMYDWQQQEQANRAQAAQGLAGLSGAYGQIQDMYKSDAQNQLDSLLALQQLLGSNMGGTGSSNQTGNQGGWQLSDDNAKENIVKIDAVYTVNGVEIQMYEYNYTLEAQEKLGVGSQRMVGAMASQVQKACPEAVQVVNGYRHVNYGMVKGE